MCDLDCGERGHCEGGVCVCDEGWRGENSIFSSDNSFFKISISSTLKILFRRKLRRATLRPALFCSRGLLQWSVFSHLQIRYVEDIEYIMTNMFSGTCLCTNGWNGKHCTLEGCPANCNGIDHQDGAGVYFTLF